MKRLKSYILSILPVLAAFLAVPGISACSDDIEVPGTDGDAIGVGDFTVTIKCADEITRATEEGDDGLNENLIESATICLWPNGGDWLTSDEPMYMETFTGLNKKGAATLRLPLTMEMIDGLFNMDGSKTCQMFVAVNVIPDATMVKTVDDLRALAISSPFDSKKKQESFTMDGDGVATFVEVGSIRTASAEIEVRRSAAKIDLHLDVTDKVTETLNDKVVEWTPDYSNMRVMLHNGVKDSQLDPKPKEVSPEARFNTPDDLSYNFELKESAEPAASRDYRYAQTFPFYTYPNSWKPDEQNPMSVVEGMTYMTLSIPWTSDGGVSYRTCYYRVPVIKPDLSELVRNTSYHVRLKVSMLGSFVPDEPFEVEPLNYSAAKWGSEDINIDINEIRYLVVDQNEFEVDNENSITIPFYTSHKTVVTSATMTFYRFNFSDEGSEFAVTVNNAQNEESLAKANRAVYTATFDNKKNNSSLKVSHTLKVWTPKDADGNTVDLTNGDKKYAASSRPRTQSQSDINKVLKKISYYTRSSADEYSKVVFKVTVQHEDMLGTSNFKETVTITQYPAMYISAVKNYTGDSDTVFDYTGGQGSTYVNNNYAQISGLTNTDPSGGKSNGWMTSIGLHSKEGYLNWNPNMYLVTVSTFNDSTNYRIGDPRIDKINNALGDSGMGSKHTTAWAGGSVGGVQCDGFAEATSLYYETSKKRTLTYYYPTDEATRTRRMIAPKFRVCSSYAGTGSILTRALARRRAAAYQEMGYAAGRWRLPTYAEVEFLMQLSADLKIPRLFGTTDSGTWTYWCANGGAVVPPKTAGAGNINPTLNTSLAASSLCRARFVYDEWFWGEETLKKISNPTEGKPKYTFTWGDKPLNMR